MRCLTLAQALRDRGANCRFILRECLGHLLKRIKRARFEAIKLPLSDKGNYTASSEDEPILAHAHWLGADWTTDASQTIAAICKTYPDWVIVDHYAGLS